MKRKITCIILVLTFLLTSLSPALAQGETAKIGQDEALKIVREAFGISENLKNINISYREEDYYNNRKLWEFHWDMSRFGKYQSISAAVDADNGEIVSFSDHKEWDPSKKPATYKSKEECKKAAINKLQKIAPQKFNQIREREFPYADYYDWVGNGPKRYTFMYERVVNGIPFPENSINISVDAETGRVCEFYCNWDSSLQFPAPEGKINQEEAEKVFRERFVLRLSYGQFGPFVPRGTSSKKTAKLYYSIWDNLNPVGMIDAVSGKVTNQFGKEIAVAKEVYLPAKPEPVPQAESKVLTMEEARARASQYVNIPAGYKVQSSRYSEGWGPGAQKTWEFQFGKDNFGQDSFNVSINAATGELVNYNRWDNIWENQENRKVNYNYDRCKDIALDFLKKAAPAKFDYVYSYDNSQNMVHYANGKAMEPPTYYFSFIRVVNGIPFSNNSVSIEVDRQDGIVRSYWCNWDYRVEFESLDSILRSQEAMDALLNAEKPKLAYARIVREDGKQSNEIRLVYGLSFELPKMVEAKTGKVTNYYELGTPAKLDDIEGHWAEREIKMLSANGIIAGSNNKFNPNSKVTRAEFATMLANAKGLETDSSVPQMFSDVPSSAWYYNSVQAISKAGFVKGASGKFDPNRHITRQEMVVMLINALNAGEKPENGGDMGGMFKDEEKVASWAKDAIIQAVEIGVLAGQDGYLKPTSPATRAEAAVMLLRIMESNELGGGFYSSRVVYR